MSLLVEMVRSAFLHVGRLVYGCDLSVFTEVYVIVIGTQVHLIGYIHGTHSMELPRI